MEKELEQINDPVEIQEEIQVEEPKVEELLEQKAAFDIEPVTELAIQPEEETPYILPERKSNKRIMTGKVKSNKADKTIVVSIVRQVKHPLYKKYYKRTKRIMAHDESNECRIGDLVKVRECRPMSARKRWELIEIVDRAK